jgi:dihydrofolate reductase
MSRIIVIQFVTLDGVVEDPDGRAGTAQGGWAFRYGPEAVAGDKFNLGRVLESGALVLGAKTWRLFSSIWPSRSDDFSQAMNRIPKLVFSRSLASVSEWSNSALVTGDMVDELSRRKQEQDLVVAGSASIVETLRQEDLIDEYRLLVFPVVLGEGRRLFPEGVAPIDLELEAAEMVGPAVRMTYRRTQRVSGGAPRHARGSHGRTTSARLDRARPLESSKPRRWS